jgi:hypothetical protein
MSTPFDLEQEILRCWNITTDLGEILDDVEGGHIEIHEAVEALRAYQRVYERRFDRCFRSFEKHTREVWQLRNQVQDAQSNLDQPPKPLASMGKKGKSKQQKEVDH